MSESYHIRKMDFTKKRDRSHFIDVPWNIYHHDNNWVPPLRITLDSLIRPDHPVHQTLEMSGWVAFKDNKAIARICALYNHKLNQAADEKIGHFGFFDSPDDSLLASKLFELVKEHLALKGVKKIQGPFNPSTNYECGLLVDGFDDPPQLMMSYNPRYYQDLIESNGFTKAKDLLAYQFEINKGMPEIIRRIAARVENKENITFRSISKKTLSSDIHHIKDIYNDAWEDNWGFVPMTEQEFAHMAAELKDILDARFALLALVNDRPVGFILSLLDYNQVFKTIKNGKLLPFGIFKILFGASKINRLRTLTLGIKKQYRGRGIETALYLKSWQNAQQAGLKEGEFSWVLEDNRMMNRPIERMGAHPYKTYRIYQKELT